MIWTFLVVHDVVDGRVVSGVQCNLQKLVNRTVLPLYRVHTGILVRLKASPFSNSLHFLSDVIPPTWIPHGTR